MSFYPFTLSVNQQVFFSFITPSPSVSTFVNYLKASTHSFPQTESSPHIFHKVLEVRTHKHGPPVAATSFLPWEKRQHMDSPSCETIMSMDRAPTKSKSGRKRHQHQWRGQRSAEAKTSRVRNYVDSGGPHRTSMVINDLTGKYRISSVFFCTSNILCQKSTTRPTTQMNALASGAMVQKSGR